MDSTEKGRTTLTSYYSEKGETPGRWVGSGLAALDMRPGSPVDEIQMRALFGSGFHPNGEARLAALPAGATPEQIRQAQRLGAPFQVRRDATRFQQLVAERCGAWLAENALKPDGEVPVDVLASVRSGLASEAFAARVGRPPSGLELSTEVARLSRNPNTACAGFDVTFSPVKSVSTLWALAPRDIAAHIEEAHNQAVEDALGYIEDHVLYSRRGAGGMRQVEVTGLIGTAFTHRDSRAGDPDLHTHVAIANKVHTLDGHWLAIDARPLYAGLVSISEVYNTSLEARLVERLGVRFAVESNRDPSKRGVREIVGVPALLREAWSKRRTAIVVREADLVVKFQADHHRPPTPVEASKLAQQATLETRDAKHEPRRIDEQRAVWRSEAERLLGPRAVGHILDAIRGSRDHKRPAVTSDWIGQAAGEIVETMGLHRASWTRWHLHAEASRRARERARNADHAKRLTEELLAAATALCVPVDAWTDPIQEPSALRRTTGESMYQTVGTRRFTSAAVLRAEQQIMDAAALTDGPRAAEADVTVALLRSTSQGIDLNAGQVDLVRGLATSGRRVQLALAAAGAGKTTALAVLADAWREAERQVVGLAPSAVAARQLEDQIGHGTTLAKLAWDIANRSSDAANLVQPGTLLIIDEAGMADTPTLARIIGYATGRGASVRLIGDDQQLAAIGAGGILRDIATTHGAVTLNQIMRFHDPAEAAASLALRDGRPEALGYYLDQNRLHPGTADTVLTGTETRQQAYVALTRGRAGNHAYIQIVSDTTEATPIDPTTLRPQTVLDVCESVLARDGAQRSVTTDTREAADPYTRLGISVARYTDALTVALEHLHPDQTLELDERADQAVDRLTDSPAWPTLRAHLLHAAAHYDQHTTPLDLLHRVTNARELATANDPAAVLTWRLPHPTATGPLPWLPDIPTDIAVHDQWGPYLAARAQQVRDTASELRHTAASPEPPEWALPGQPLTPELVADIEVWRASWQVDRADRRPTGPARLGTLPARHQQQLQDRIHPVDPVHPWLQRLHDIRHDIPQDDSAPALAHRLADLHRQGLPAARLLTQAADDGPLPAEQPADALWWRITRHLHLDNPSGQNQATTTETLHPTPVVLPGDFAALLAQASGRNKTHHETHTRPTPQAPPR